MNQIAWDDSYNIGVDFIDEEHKGLFSRINKLLKLNQTDEKSEWVCREGVKFLKYHTAEHFDHEEEYMQSINYEDYETHKRLHDAFRYTTLPILEKELEETGYSSESIRHFLGVCIGWIVGHTKMEDQAIVGKDVKKWVNIPRAEEKDALEVTIIQIMRNVFQLKTKLIHEQYTGENFGKIVCCQFLYRGDNESNWSVTLVYEDRLLLEIMGTILKTDYPKIDDMILNVARYLSRQFLEKIWESFQAQDLVVLEKECLLTHEQLLNSFERNQASCSLLFDTGSGYFAFCASSAGSIQENMSTANNYQNALTMVRDFLTKNQAENESLKKKIIVVDDSEFLRSKIIKLLEADYDVIEADSSISAIKKIAVNRPDLVILDYEMPVCDGLQTLEMIRSDADIANIPVIFLTGKGDRESVQKAMSLKPEGYLLKSLPDAKIKEVIDNFFAKQE
ncbi:MAG: response regulator [Lachnospiraceae bacterium]|nr:response regulator [Lachnospiraceae bacterium]